MTYDPKKRGCKNCSHWEPKKENCKAGGFDPDVGMNTCLRHEWK